MSPIRRRSAAAVVPAAALASLVVAAPAAAATTSTPPDWFVRLDRDGDGLLSLEEFPSGSFDSLDRNGDGFLSREEIGSADGVAIIVDRDLRYRDDLPGVDPRLVSLDVHRPAEGSAGATPRPVLVMIHGGGWRGGDKASSGVVTPKAPWLIGAGWIVVSVNYRLSPDVRHPAHIDDVAHAIAWIGREIEQFGGDPERLVLMGHSAGAHLAALAAADADRLRAAGGQPESIRGVVLLDGAGYDIPLTMRDAGPRLRDLYSDAFGTVAANWPDASPAEHFRRRAAGDSDRNPPPPPLLILHIDRAAAATQARVLADTARAAGGTAEIHRFPGETHASINRRLGEPGHDPTEVTEAFLRRILTPAGPSDTDGRIFDAPADGK